MTALETHDSAFVPGERLPATTTQNDCAAPKSKVKEEATRKTAIEHPKQRAVLEIQE